MSLQKHLNVPAPRRAEATQPSVQGAPVLPRASSVSHVRLLSKALSEEPTLVAL